MKNSILLILFVLSSFCHVQSQDLDLPEVKMGKVKKFGFKTFGSWVFNDTEDNYYVVEMDFILRGSKVMIVKYDKDFKKLAENTLDFKIGGKKFLLDKPVFFNNQVQLFTYVRDKGNYYYYFTQTLDKETLKPVGGMKILSKSLGKIKNGISYKVRSFINYSPDSTKIVSVTHVGKKSKKRWLCTVLDENMEVLWRKPVYLGEPKRKMEFQDCVVNNDGDVSVLARHAYGAATRYKLMNMANNGTSQNSIFIGMDDGFQNKNFKLFMDKQANVYCAGFYGKTVRREDGYYIAKLPTGAKDFSFQKRIEFTDDVYSKILEYHNKDIEVKKEKDKEQVVMKATPKYAVFYPNGDFTIISEQSIPVSMSYSSHILVASYDALGTQKWIKVIPKIQIGAADAYSSFVLVEHKDKLDIFFNDTAYNEDLLETGGKCRQWSYGFSKKSVIMFNSIDRAGNLARSTLVNLKNGGFSLVPEGMNYLKTEKGLLVPYKNGENEVKLVKYVYE